MKPSNRQLQNQFVALLRGINVGGHHKVPMDKLKKLMTDLGFQNVVTLLNSGNAIFETSQTDIPKMEKLLSEKLMQHFGFPIPVILVDAKEIFELLKLDPFQKIKLTKDTRLYVSFLKVSPKTKLTFPWISEDNSFQILGIKNKSIFSVLDLSISKSPKVMEALELMFGKEMTTRNWQTVLKIAEKIQ